MTSYICRKCCNFGPGDPCIINMDKEAPSPTFCPSDDGKYPGAEWLLVVDSKQEEIERLRNEKDIIRKALIGLIGMEKREDLELLEVAMDIAPEAVRAVSINAIHALIETA